MSRWEGKTVAVLASGPSLTAEDCAFVCDWRARNEGARVIAINTTFRLAPWADVVYGCDSGWWREYLGAVREAAPDAELWTQDPLAAAQYGLRYIESHRGAGLTRRPGLIYQGMNSGHQAIALAAGWGARKIVLLGLDMQAKDKSHWHGDHPPGLKKIPPFALWIEHLEKLAADLRQDDIETINASRETALRCFRRMDLEAACAN